MAVFQAKPSQKPQKNFYAYYYRKDLTQIRYKRRKPPAVTIYRGNFAPKKFTGKEQDQETGLYYFGARYLDPKTSRWLSTDPALGDYLPVAGKENNNLPNGGVYNSFNLHAYHYANNNPVKYVDPDGRTPGDPFDTANAAAVDVLDYINPTSIKENVEYAGVIYRNPDTGKFYATEPRSKDNALRSNAGKEPEGMERVGDYHTHGDYSMEYGGVIKRTSDPNLDNLDSDNFSPGDIRGVHGRSQYHPGLKGYLGTPSGVYKKYDPVTSDGTKESATIIGVTISNYQQNLSSIGFPSRNNHTLRYPIRVDRR